MSIRCWLGFHSFQAITADWLGGRVTYTLFRCVRCGLEERR